MDPISRFFYFLFTNKIFLSVFFSMIISVITKIIIIYVKEKNPKLKTLYRDGGMPSTHTASVVGITFGIYLFDGINTMFVVSLVFAAIVIHDAMGVRKETEKHAKFLNELIKNQKIDKTLFSEHIGHKLPEVIVGALIGLIVPTIIYLI